MTRRAGESYEDFVSRAAANPISRTVKMADLRTIFKWPGFVDWTIPNIGTR